jgi:hypothetical protein
MDRILALSDEALDAELRAEGLDPAAERARGAALARELLAARDGRNRWQGEAQAKLDAARARVAARPRPPKMSRAALVAAVERACSDPRFGARASVMYRNRGGIEASDDELEALLVQLEALADQVDAEKK